MAQDWFGQNFNGSLERLAGEQQQQQQVAILQQQQQQVAILQRVCCLSPAE
jgi:hypothetical protein